MDKNILVTASASVVSENGSRINLKINTAATSKKMFSFLPISGYNAIKSKSIFLNGKLNASPKVLLVKVPL